MICEFALTPQIFDPEAHDDRDVWLGRVSRLLSDMLPRTGHQPVCVADLYNGSWRHEVASIARACNAEVRGDVMKLLSRVDDLCVYRDAEGNWPHDEDAWANEAVTCSHRECPMSQIWASDGCCARLGGNGLATIADVADAARWNDLRPARRVGMSIPEQVDALRVLTFHSSWLAYVNPYIHGSSAGDELSLALDLLTEMRGRRRNTPVLLDLHTEDPTNRANVIANVQHRLPPAHASFQIRMFFWAFPMLDRYILAGDVNAAATELTQQRVRWVINPGHIARSQVNTGEAPTPWSLLPRFDVNTVFAEYYTKAPAVPAVRLR